MKKICSAFFFFFFLGGPGPSRDALGTGQWKLVAATRTQPKVQETAVWRWGQQEPRDDDEGRNSGHAPLFQR